MEKMEMTVRRLAIYPRRRRPRSIAVVLLVILAAAGMYLRRTRTGTPTGGDDRSRYDQRVCTVARVVDGDTIDVSVPDGRFGTTRIRLWGVDTPEVAGSPVGKMYFGSEASAFTKAMVQGGRVRLALEPADVASRGSGPERARHFVWLGVHGQPHRRPRPGRLSQLRSHW